MLPEDLVLLDDDLVLLDEDLVVLPELDRTDPDDLVALVGVVDLELDLTDRVVVGLVTLLFEFDLVVVVDREFLIVLVEGLLDLNPLLDLVLLKPVELDNLRVE